MSGMRKIRVIDLFAGIGGLSEGFLRVRRDGHSAYRLVLAADHDEEAAFTHRMNRPSVPYLVADLAELGGDELLAAAGLGRGDIDCLIGGPPCQGFSPAGPRRPVDPRNDLVVKFVDLAADLEPRFVLLENVPQLRGFAGGRYWRGIVERLQELRYDVAEGVLSAWEYGVPQMRRRAFIMATLADHSLGPLKWPAPTHGLLPTGPRGEQLPLCHGTELFCAADSRGCRQ